VGSTSFGLRGRGKLIAVRFRDRAEAGRALARELQHLRDDDAVVLALPRGGVPVAAEVARALGAPLDVLVVRKLGVPGHEELAFGAIASGGVRVLVPPVVADVRLDAETIATVTETARHELELREQLYRGGRPRADVDGRSVVLVDDGLATGATMRAAVAAARGLGAHRVVVAVPIAAAQTADALRDEADEVVVVATPYPFLAVGSWYDDFSPVSDDEVRRSLGV
jgi:predicted phosphoribosyltransferase